MTRVGDRNPNPPPNRCPVTERGCRAVECGPRRCIVLGHLGRLTRTSLVAILRHYAEVDVAPSDAELRRLVRDTLNSDLTGQLLHRAIVEASLKALAQRED